MGDMMMYLCARKADFSHVVAVDEHLDVFSRIWCIAELVMSYRLHLDQVIKVHSAASLEKGIKLLHDLDVSKAEASRSEDKVAILAKIPDVKKFNQELHDILLGTDRGLLL